MKDEEKSIFNKLTFTKQQRQSTSFGIFQFTIPNMNEALNALDLVGEPTHVKKAYLTDIEKFYYPIYKVPYNEKEFKNLSKRNNPELNWIYTHKEYGQTYKQFLTQKPFYRFDKNSKNIYLVNLKFSKKLKIMKHSKSMINLKRKDYLLYKCRAKNYGKDANPLIIPLDKNYLGFLRKKIYEANEQELDVEIPEPIDKETVEKFLGITSAYFDSVSVKKMEKTIRLENLIYKKDIKTKKLLSIEADYLVKHIFENFIFQEKTVEELKYEQKTGKVLKPKKKKPHFCYVFFTNIPLFHDVTIFKDHLVNKYQFYPQMFLQNEFCFEMSNIEKRVSLISLAQFAYNNNVGVIEKAVSNKRNTKLIIRAVCEMFGLKNCIYFSCLMNGFGTLREFDSHPMELCPICLRKLFSILMCQSGPSGGNDKSPFALFQRFLKIKNYLESLKKGKEDMKNSTNNNSNSAPDEKERNAEYYLYRNEINWYKAKIETLKKTNQFTE